MNNFVDLVILGCSFETFYYKKLSLILFLRLLIFLVAWFLCNLTIGGGGRGTATLCHGGNVCNTFLQVRLVARVKCYLQDRERGVCMTSFTSAPFTWSSKDPALDADLIWAIWSLSDEIICSADEARPSRRCRTSAEAIL